MIGQSAGGTSLEGSRVVCRGGEPTGSEGEQIARRYHRSVTVGQHMGTEVLGKLE